MKKPEKIRADTLAAIAALPEDEQARLAVELAAYMRRIRREAYAKLKETHSFAEVGKMFGISGSRVDQIIRGG